MPISDRDYVRGSHPPTCTCVDCCRGRLDGSGGRGTRVGTATPSGGGRGGGSYREGNSGRRGGHRRGCGCGTTAVVIILVVLLAVICAFIGIEPMSSAKDRIINLIEQGWQTTTAPSQSPTPALVSPTSEPVKQSTLVPPSSPLKPSESVQTIVGYTDEEVEEFVHALINRERQSFGLSPLSKNPLLMNLAKEHSISMASYRILSHGRIAGEKSFGYGQPTDTTRGENISLTPQRKWVPGPYLSLKEVCEWAVSGWMESEGHRENILEPGFTKTGIGVSRRGEYLYMTQMFESD